MPAENELQIVLKLVDEATKDLKAVNGSIGELQKPLSDIKKEGEQANKTLQEGFNESTRQAKSLRRDVMLVVGVITTLVQSTREYAKYNASARQSVNDFDLAVQQMSVNVGKALMPILSILTLSAKGWAMISNVLSNLMSGKGFVLTEDKDVENIIRARQELQYIADNQKQMNELFLTGRLDAEAYYEVINGVETQTLGVRQQAMAQMQELASLTTMVRSQEIMEAQRATDEQIGLLNFYKENYMQAHAGMRAMTVELGKSLKTNLSAGISDVILNVKSAREAFRAFGDAMVKAVVDFMVQKVVAWVLEKTLLAGTVASSAVAGASVAAAWAPAAAMVSLATLGANAVPASAALINVTILSAALAAPKAMAYGGDGVVNRPTLFLAGENGPERAIFQPLGSSSRGSSGGSTINIYSPVVTNTDAINELAEVISTRLARETERI